MDRFWMLYAEGGRGPTHKHQTYKDAQEEAERLIREDSAAQVYILEAVAMAKPADVVWDVLGPALPR